MCFIDIFIYFLFHFSSAKINNRGGGNKVRGGGRGFPKEYIGGAIIRVTRVGSSSTSTLCIH